MADAARPTVPAPTTRARVRSDIGVGIATLAAIVAAASAGILLPGYLRAALPYYTITVPAGEDISGIARGTPVLVGGLQRGRVLSVTDRPDANGQSSFLIEFEIEPRMMSSNLRARFVRSPISNKSVINFTSIEGVEPTEIAPGTDVKVSNEVSDASLFMTPAAQRAFATAWKRIDRAMVEWPPMATHAKERTMAVIADAGRLKGEFDATFPGNADRIQALIDRFRAIGDRLTETKRDWDALRAEAEGVRGALSQEGTMGVLSRSLSELGSRFEVIGADGRSLGTIVDGIKRRWSDLAASGSRVLERWRELAKAVDLHPATTDFTIAATELADMSNHVLRTAAGVVFPNRNDLDELREARDQLSRQLLFGIEQARRAEAALRALLDGTRELPTQANDLERMIESMNALGELERLLFDLRVPGDGKSDADGNGEPRPGTP